MQVNRLPIAFGAAKPYMIQPEIYTVEACLGRGRYAYHVGPGTHPYFTIEQAEALSNRVNTVGDINPEHWTDGNMHPLTENRTDKQYMIHRDIDDREDEEHT